jgi:tetratricopeptide (TPR) repeat protein
MYNKKMKSLKSKCRVLVLILVLFWASSLNCVFCADNGLDNGLIYEQYYLNQSNGNKVGYTFVEQKNTTYKNQQVVLTHKHTQQQIKRFGLPLDVVQDINFYETLSGKPLFVDFSSKTGDENIKYTAEFLSDNKVLISNADSPQPKEINIDGNIILPYGIDKLFKEKFQDEKIEYTTIDPESNFRTIKVTATKDNDKYDISFDIVPNVQSYQWRDSNGRIIKYSSGVSNIEQIAAIKTDIFKEEGDIFQRSQITVDGTLNNIKNIKEVTYKLSLGAYPANYIPNFLTSQHVIQTKNNTVYIKIKQRNYNDQVFKYPPKNKNIQSALKPSLYIDYNDKNIESIVNAQLKGVSKDSYKIAKKLERYVKREIKTENNKVKIKKASQTLADKSGDITDKSILLAAMLRKANIPAKVIVGAKYSNTPTSFSYYCWVVAKMGDEWVNLDCNFDNENISTVDYIGLADSDFALNKPVDELLSGYLEKLSNIKVSFLDFSLVDNIEPSEIDSSVKLSDIGIWDYLKNSGLSANDLDYKKTSDDDLRFLKISNAESQKYLEEAYRAYIQNNIDEAVANFNKAFDLTPVNDDYQNIDYANKLASLGLFSLAKGRLANIYDYQIWENKIEALYKMYLPKVLPDSDEERILTKILSMATYSPNSLDLADVSSTFENKKYKQSDYANYILAKVYFVKKDNKKACHYINTAISQNPNNYLYRILKINILAAKGDYNGALKILDNLVDENINDRDLAYGLKLHKYHLLAKKSKNQADQNYYLARFFLMSRQDAKAKELADKNTQLRNNVLDYDLLGRIYFNAYNFAKAKEAYDKAISINPKDITAIEGIGNLHYILHNYKNAEENYEQALKYSKNSDKLLLKIANCKRDMSEDQQALEKYYQVLKIDPDNYLAIYNIADLEGKLDNNATQKDIYKKILSINPNYTPAWIGLLRSALIEKNTFLARQYLVNISHINGSSPIYYYYSGIIEVMDENYSYARRDFNMALQKDPNFTPAKVELEKLK